MHFNGFERTLDTPNWLRTHDSDMRVASLEYDLAQMQSLFYQVDAFL